MVAGKRGAAGSFCGAARCHCHAPFKVPCHVLSELPRRGIRVEEGDPAAGLQLCPRQRLKTQLPEPTASGRA